MTLDLLRGHPDLVAELDPDATRRCGGPARTPVHTNYGSWYCTRLPRWRVKGHPPQCGQHAAIALRRLLADPDPTAGGDR